MNALAVLVSEVRVMKTQRKTFTLWFGIVLLAIGAPLARGETPRQNERQVTVDFARDIYPILRRSCFECHSKRKSEGDLRLDDRSTLFDSGIVEPGFPDDSELLRRIMLPAGDADVMPALGEPLPARETAIIRQWIAAGAQWPEQFQASRHWSYIAPRRPLVPDVSTKGWAKSNLDLFVLKRLEEEGLTPSGRAQPEALVRRLFLDLIGLPPTPEEVSAFLADPSDAGVERLVDGLLQRPQFGERWARPWLDLARYADSHGFQRDDWRYLWAYRDWVIRALNNDMPFDQFTIEQIAGDLLPNATESQRTATGFHRCTPTNVEAGSLPEETRIEQVIDRVNTTGAVWLGTTLECAQCHDHKYDPITMEDYYGLLAFFNSTELEADRKNPKVPSSIAFRGPYMELENPVRAQRRTELQQQLSDLKSRRAARTNTRKATLEKKDDEESKKIASRISAVEERIEQFAPQNTLVMKELAQPRRSTKFQRGDYRKPAGLIEPGTPKILHSLSAGPPSRLSLARWLVDPENPLVARVTVNRWWAELFGRGIVSTVEDFGLKGEPPTHPELLDWLAIEYVESGWSLKHLLRTIALSATYQQSSRSTPESLARDNLNRLLARGARFRMDAEMIRDNALRISGLLSLIQYGPSIRPHQPDGVWDKIGGTAYKYVVSPGDERQRRGVYVVLKRGAPYPSFVNFDASARLTCTVKRSRTNTPLQALTLLNDPVYVEAAKALAARILAEKEHYPLANKLAFGFRLCTARNPTENERDTLIDLFDSQLEEYERSPDAAERLGMDTPVPNGTSVPEFAAWYSVATVLLNMHETITKQ